MARRDPVARQLAAGRRDVRVALAVALVAGTVQPLSITAPLAQRLGTIPNWSSYAVLFQALPYVLTLVAVAGATYVATAMSYTRKR